MSLANNLVSQVTLLSRSLINRIKIILKLNPVVQRHYLLERAINTHVLTRPVSDNIDGHIMQT